MSDPLFDTSDGNTPIDEDEALGLRLTWVRTRGDLNEAAMSPPLSGPPPGVRFLA